MDLLSPASYWNQSVGTPSLTFPPLNEDRRVDVAIIGAGITGLTAALHLKRAGKQVAVLEAGRVGAGTTGGTSGHLEVAPDQGWVKLVRDFGESTARQVTDLRRRAIDQIEDWVQRFNIDCDFKRVSARAYTEREDRVELLRKEYATAMSMGLDVAWKEHAGLPFATAATIEIRDQARFHSMKYLRGLARAVHGDNATIHENTRAQPPEDGSPCVIETGGHRLQADSVVLATHSAYLGISQFELLQAPYQSYVLAVRVADDVPDALYWDDDRPYHYLRLAKSDDPRLLIVGGADHKTGQADTEKHARRLVDFVSERFSVERIEYQWSAEYFEPADGLPMIGPVPMMKHLYLATGFSGTGLTYGTVAGGILAEMIQTGSSPDANLFSPARIKPLAAAKDIVSENVNAAMHFLGDRFGVEQVDSFDSIPAGEGRVVKFDGQTYAAYRDEQGQLHLRSPVCTHAGCYVKWNRTERTWDCPCHGGRFSPTGERMYGPPAADLHRVEIPSAIGRRADF